MRVGWLHGAMTLSSFGTPLSDGATKVLLLGAGELGKELAFAFQRLGVEVVAADRYEHAPAMQVAHRSYVVDLLDPDAVRAVVETEQPSLIVPEIDAINTDELEQCERRGFRVVPSASAARVTMDRERMRHLVAEELGIATSPYRVAESADDVRAAVAELGLPVLVKPLMSSSSKGQSVVTDVSECDHAWHHAADDVRAAVAELGLPVLVKPLMSSSSKGQSVVTDVSECDHAWHHAAEDGRATSPRVIVESVVDFDYEITLLTVRHIAGTTFMDPIGHIQGDGGFRESWQPQPMSQAAASEARRIATAVTDALGGWGVFGVELFVRGDDVIFSEVSPRPHDTGMVTLASSPANEFAVHVSAVLGLPVHHVIAEPAAACALVAEGTGVPTFHGVADALSRPDTDLRLFGKPWVEGRRRVGVALARGLTIDEARARAAEAANSITITLD